MSADAELASRIEALLAPQIEAQGYRLLEVIFRVEGRWLLRLVVDREQGLTLDDCSNISELAGRILDVEDPIPQEYALEVTSPGVFRKLKERRHFAQSVGKLIRCHLAPEVLPERKERTLRGSIEAVDGDIIVIAEHGRQDSPLRLPVDGIRSARLDPEL
jgi:ribosome maturation factor RimP